MTLALPKIGLLLEVATPYVGELFLADIGVPPRLYEAIGIFVDGSTLFGCRSTFRVR